MKNFSLLVSMLFIGLFSYGQAKQKLDIVAIDPIENAGQRYASWLKDDDLSDLINDSWSPENFQYADIKLTLKEKSEISALSLYDWQGIFADNPASIYAVNGSVKTLLATFKGESYQQWVDVVLQVPVTAEAIVVRKFGNNVPQKIRIFGTVAAGLVEKIATEISFANITEKIVTDPPFNLVASSNNSVTPIVFTSSNPQILSVTNVNGIAKATIHSAGTVKIVASQAGNDQYKDAVAVERTVIIADNLVESIINFPPLAEKQVGDEAFTISATSNNTSAPIVFSSSHPNIVALTEQGGVWKASIVAAGSATITASQAAGKNYTAAESVQRTLVIAAAGAAIAGDRIKIISATAVQPSPQDFSAWLNDDTTHFIPDNWASANFNYIDVKLTFDKRSQIEKVSLFDFEGSFTDNPASIYALDGTERKLIGTFTGEDYMKWIDLQLTEVLVADAIIIRKYGNNIPGKIKVFGKPASVNDEKLKSLIAFPTLPKKTVGDAPYNLVAKSNNSETPIVFSSSNPAVVSVSNATGAWKATVLKAGTATITASQSGNSNYLPAPGVGHTQLVEAAVPPKTYKPLPGLVQAEEYTTMSGIETENTNDGGSAKAVIINSETDWLAYDVKVAATSDYQFELSVLASEGGSIEITTAGGTVVTAVTPSNSWTLVKTTVALKAGTQVLKISVKKARLKLGWFKAAFLQNTQTGKIPIHGKRWYQLNNTSSGLSGLFDGNTSAAVHTGWGHILSNFDAYYALKVGEEINIESIKMYDGEGSNQNAPFTISAIMENWTRIPIASFTGGAYMKWVGPNPAKPDEFKLDKPMKNVRYLVINTTSAYPTEIEFYGTYKEVPAATAPTPKHVKLKQTFGVNAFEWDFEHPNSPDRIDESRLKAVKSFTGIRHYMDWEKLELKEGSYTYNPVHSGGWNYDAIYERCKLEGIEVLACLKTIPKWMQDTYPQDQRELENVPVKYGKDFSNPNSYREQAKVAFQYAARYGSNKNVNTALLSVNATPRWGGDVINTVKVGLDLVKYIECDNERDKWWKGRKAYQTAREYAANLSAFYDGHKGTMGAGVGIKQADPNMQVVMAGLALPSTDYVKGMIDWCIEFRGYKADGSVNLCWDVINYHLYSNDSKSSQSGNPTRGAAPEVSEAASVAADFMQVAHEYAYDMPVWVTECGYDVNPGSPIKAIPIGRKSALATQADWILRTALLYARAGVESVFFYQLLDDNAANPTQFSSSGLINADRTRKPAADFLYQTQKLFGEFAYQETLKSDPIVDRYERDGQSVFMLVVPDEKGRTADYTLDLGTADSAFIYTPVAGSDDMNLKKVKTSNGKVTITVTETPVFVTGVGMANHTESRSETGNNFRSIVNPFNSYSSAYPGVALLDQIKLIDGKANAAPGTIKIFPNPATGYINIFLNSGKAGKVTARVVEAVTGRVYKTVDLMKAAGEEIKRLNVDFLTPGFYVVEVKQGANVFSKKIQIVAK